MKNYKLINILSLIIIILLFLIANAYATVETGWPKGTPNSCNDPSDFFIDFEEGIEAFEIESTIPGVEFTTTSGINWRYADIRTGYYNSESYANNGNFIAWLGETGDMGIISFTGGPASYVSVLVSTSSGVTLDAFDADGNFLATSGWAENNLDTDTMTRLTVEAENIAYVEIHDTGNYWIMDDLCTNAESACIPVPNRSIGKTDERIDLVFVADEDYNGDFETLLENIDHKIDNRLGGHSPVDSNLDKFNFYYTELEGDVTDTDSDGSADNCGDENSLPDNMFNLCPFMDSFVVLHTAPLSDCKYHSGPVTIFSAEGNSDRSFIHEAGHGLFGLKDEYDSSGCSTNYRGGGTPSNIWATEDDCTAAAEGKGWTSDYCYKFTDCMDDWWKIGDGSLANDDERYLDENFQFIMKDGNDFSKGWGEPAEFRISWVFENIPLDTVPGGAEPSNEKSIILKLTINDTGLYLTSSNFTVSPPPNFLPGDYDLTVIVNSNTGVFLGEYGFNDPRFVDAEEGYNGPLKLEVKDFTLIFPYFNHIGSAEIFDRMGNSLLNVDLSNFASNINEPPVCDANGPYMEECQGAETSIVLDGSGTSDPDGDPITFSWFTDCPAGTFDDHNKYNPEITLNTPDNNLPSCNVELLVTDPNGESDSCSSNVTIVDTTPPDIICPADITIECDESSDPTNTGIATITDVCDSSPTTTYSDVTLPGSCPEESTITRTWTATDASGNSSNCVQTIEVVDTTPPEIECNAPPTITPKDAPVSFTATAEDNCDDNPLVEITGYTCNYITPNGKSIDKAVDSCIVSFAGDTVTIDDSGGIKDRISWTIEATDCKGNQATTECFVDVVNSGQQK